MTDCDGFGPNRVARLDRVNHSHMFVMIGSEVMMTGTVREQAAHMNPDVHVLERFRKFRATRGINNEPLKSKISCCVFQAPGIKILLIKSGEAGFQAADKLVFGVYRRPAHREPLKHFSNLQKLKKLFISWHCYINALSGQDADNAILL